VGGIDLLSAMKYGLSLPAGLSAVLPLAGRASIVPGTATKADLAEFIAIELGHWKDAVNVVDSSGKVRIEFLTNRINAKGGQPHKTLCSCVQGRACFHILYVHNVPQMHCERSSITKQMPYFRDLSSNLQQSHSHRG